MTTRILLIGTGELADRLASALSARGATLSGPDTPSADATVGVALLGPALGPDAALTALRATAPAAVTVLIDPERSRAAKQRAYAAGADAWVAADLPLAALASAVLDARARAPEPPDGAIVIGALIIDPAAETVTLDHTPITLTSQAFAALAYLAARAGTRTPRADLLAHLFPDEPPADPAMVDDVVLRLRHRLAAAAEGADFIEGGWSEGYRLFDPDAAPAEPTTAANDDRPSAPLLTPPDAADEPFGEDDLDAAAPAPRSRPAKRPRRPRFTPEAKRRSRALSMLQHLQLCATAADPDAQAKALGVRPGELDAWARRFFAMSFAEYRRQTAAEASATGRRTEAPKKRRGWRRWFGLARDSR